MRSCPNRPEGPTTITGWPRTRLARLSGATWPRSRRWPSIGCWRSATSGTGGSAPPLNIRAVATSAVTEAAQGKQIIFFPARHDHHLVQTGDGYAAHVSGAIGVSTDAQASWWGGKGVGTVPHSLIAAYNGDTVLAAQKYAEYIDPSANLIVLVDWQNDCVRTSLEVARALGDRLWGVRLDTSETMVDISIQKLMGDFDPRGVNPQLCTLVRRALDREGFEHVKIVASGGFNVEKIQRFEREQVPVDAYGVGSAFFQGVYDFTADVVVVEGRPCAKIGRRYRPNPRLELVG